MTSKGSLKKKRSTKPKSRRFLRKILAPEAQQRLNNLKMVKQEFAEQIEMQLIQMAQTGKLPIPLSDDQLKQILIQLQSRKRETTIRRI